ncbi:MAG: MoaD/ThiS family protein [Candidatus Aenigmarchaeota archaeon]|nr:MoaD/ThiS family protein [Candidatus Aenigmarchaeota archaeon]
MVHVSYQGKKHLLQLREPLTVRQLLEQLKINPETVLVGLRGKIIPETALVADGDELDVIRTISGG